MKLLKKNTHDAWSERSHWASSAMKLNYGPRPRNSLSTVSNRPVQSIWTDTIARLGWRTVSNVACNDGNPRAKTSVRLYLATTRKRQMNLPLTKIYAIMCQPRTTTIKTKSTAPTTATAPIKLMFIATLATKSATPATKPTTSRVSL